MKIIAAVLGVALVLVGGAAIHFWRDAQAGRLQIAALQAQLADGASRVAAPAPGPAEATALGPAAPLATRAATGPAPATPAPSPAVTADVSTIVEMLRANQSSPEAQARRRQTGRMLLNTANPDLAEALDLSPEEAEKLLDLLVSHQEDLTGVFGIGTDSASLSVQDRAARAQERRQAHEAELQAMLGSKYPRWQDYSQARGAWQQRRDLRAVLDAGGIPLTEAQDRSLIASLSTEYRRVEEDRRSAAMQQGPSAIDVMMTRYTPEARQRMLDAAAPHLSPQQLEGYRGMLDRAAAQEQSMRSTLRSATEAAAAAQRQQPQP